MSKVKIPVGIKSAAVSMADQITAAGFSLTRNTDGEVALHVKFPGIDTMELSRDDLQTIADTLERPTTPGDNPGAVFERSASEDSDGNLTSKFSDAKRSRSLTFSVDDRDKVADILNGHLEKWGMYVATVEEAEEEANKSTDSTGDNASE